MLNETFKALPCLPQTPQMLLSRGVTLASGFAVPLYGFLLIGAYSPAEFQASAVIALAEGIPLFCREPVPVSGPVQVLADTPSPVVKMPDVVLRSGMPGLCSTAVAGGGLHQVFGASVFAMLPLYPFRKIRRCANISG